MIPHFSSIFHFPLLGGGRGFPIARFEIFSGTLPPQRSDRRENCLSAKREFFPGSAARRKQGRKNVLSAEGTDSTPCLTYRFALRIPN